MSSRPCLSGRRRGQLSAAVGSAISLAPVLVVGRVYGTDFVIFYVLLHIVDVEFPGLIGLIFGASEIFSNFGVVSAVCGPFCAE